MKTRQTGPSISIIERLKSTLPIIQAPMAGGATTPELVAAVSNAGGVGSLGAGYMTPDEIRFAIQKIRSLTNQPFAVNLFIPEQQVATDKEIIQAQKSVQASCPELNFKVNAIKPPYVPSYEKQMQVLIEEKVPIFSFTFGIPSKDWITIFKKNNIVLIGTATSLTEGVLLEENDIDIIVAQGSEAGGHRGTFIGKAEDTLIKTSELVPLLSRKINIPIIAAGGIMTAKEMKAALGLGASAVQMGTAFLCCYESGIHPLYKKILLNLSHDTTTLTKSFSGKLARGILNTFIIRMKAHEKNILNYPIQHALTREMRKEAAKQNNMDFMSLWAGQGAHLCEEFAAAQLIEKLKKEVTGLI